VNSMSTVTKQGGATGRVEWSVQPGALACSAEQPQHSHDQMGWTDTAAGAAAGCTDVSLPKVRVTAERLDTSAQPASIARQPSGAMVSAAADGSASVSVRAEDASVATSTGSDDEGTEVERSLPGSPTASEAALLGVLMLQQGSAEALQADIMSAFGASAPGSSQVSGGSGGGDAAGTSTVHPPRARRVAVASGKRKGGMPAVCPCCGQLPLSEEDKRAASKRGRRKKADESGEACIISAHASDVVHAASPAAVSSRLPAAARRRLASPGAPYSRLQLLAGTALRGAAIRVERLCWSLEYSCVQSCVR
jgi:hypothetical protein